MGSLPFSGERCLILKPLLRIINAERCMGPDMPNLPIDDDAAWQCWRDEWPIRSDTVYLNHGSFGPPPRRVIEAQRQWLERHFMARLFPLLTPIAVDPPNPFPFIANRGISMIVDLWRAADDRHIHGLVPMDGHVLLAEYDSLESAQAVLAQLPPNWVAGHDPRKDGDAVDRSSAVRATPGLASVTSITDQPAGVTPAYFLGRPSATWRAALQPRLRPAA